MRKKFLILPIIACLILLSFATCILNPHNNPGDDPGLDTITGWEWAGIVSLGDYGQHVDVCNYNEHMFTFNYRGELFQCIYPDFSWSQMSIPNGERIYNFYCDTVNGDLYITTKECGVYEYSINSRSWRGLVPNDNNWYDSTKLYYDSLNVYIYNIVYHQNMLYVLTLQRWNFGVTVNFDVHIWKSNGNMIWERADSGWVKEGVKGYTITDFFTIDDYLWATTFDEGLWRYDGVSWMVIPGTTQEDVHDIIDSGGDTKIIPGFRPRSMIKHNNDIYVGNLGGLVHQLLFGNTWDRTGLYYREYYANDTVDFGPPSMSMFSYNGHLIRGTLHFDETADLWYNMTPHFNKIDTTYNKGLPGTVYGMTNIGDTLFAALGNNEGKHSGVYFLDLKKCKWYEKYH